MPTPDASWAPAAQAAFAHWEQGLDLSRLAIFAVITGIALMLFLLALASPRLLRR